MNDDEEKLIEEMSKAYFKPYSKEPFKNVLDVVKQNIGAVAEVCPDCWRSHQYCDGSCECGKCKTCNGTGVVSK